MFMGFPDSSGRRQWHPTPVLLPGKSHGRRSLVGCSPSDTTERLHFHFSLSCIGEGNGNPLQDSRLGDAMDRGVWWATVHWVAGSQTWLSTRLHVTTQWRGPDLRLACGSAKAFGHENVQLIHKLGNTHTVPPLSSHHVGDQPAPPQPATHSLCPLDLHPLPSLCLCSQPSAGDVGKE